MGGNVTIWLIYARAQNEEQVHSKHFTIAIFMCLNCLPKGISIQRKTLMVQNRTCKVPEMQVGIVKAEKHLFDRNFTS